MRIKYIAVIGMLSALLVVVQVALGFLPNVELVSLLIILFTLFFGKKTIYIIYVFVIVEGFIYGITAWWFNYLYIWTVLFAITMLYRKNKSGIYWAFINGFYGLSFGALCSIPYFITLGIPSGFAYWVSGIPFDITHGFFNFAIALALFRPLYYLFDKVKNHSEILS
ncbi:MAG: hypothetical protein K0S76_2250 [Herbinix sp.]|jgi:energy-coupling factor transport system substrate-specific component|nr:hypothetical protein [Herbinix sp.]